MLPSTICFLSRPCADPEGGQGVRTPLKNHKNIGFHINTGPDPLKKHKATKPAFNVWPPSARQRNAIQMAFRWRADDGPFIVVFGSFLPSSTKKQNKKKRQSWTPSDKTFWIRACLPLSVFFYFKTNEILLVYLELLGKHH